MRIREFRQQGRRHVLVWRVAVEGDTVYTWHGVLDGKLQHTSDKKFGRYYRLLMPGKYIVTYAPDHGKPIRKDVEIHNDSQTTVDIDLSVR